MSCGRHHDTDCRQVLDRVYEYLDAEVTPDDLRRIRVHLEECGPCLAEYDLENALKALVRRCCQDQAPADLRVRIMARISAARVQMDS